jgi:hypothetical protein
MQLSCEFCLWWEAEPGDAGAGRCHRYPPTAGGFPAVSRAAYCGEFTPRTYAAAARRALSAEPAATPDDRLSAELAATIAAAVAAALPEPHRILAVQPVTGPAPTNLPFVAPINTWALEGRVQLFSSHKVR